MIIYSVTVSVEQSIQDEWLHWMRTIHIPEVMETGFFEASSIQELLDPVPQKGAATFNIQYECSSMESYEQYQQTMAPSLQQAHTERYKDRFVAFRTLLRRIE